MLLLGTKTKNSELSKFKVSTFFSDSYLSGLVCNLTFYASFATASESLRIAYESGEIWSSVNVA